MPMNNLSHSKFDLVLLVIAIINSEKAYDHKAILIIGLNQFSEVGTDTLDLTTLYSEAVWRPMLTSRRKMPEDLPVDYNNLRRGARKVRAFKLFKTNDLGLSGDQQFTMYENQRHHI